MTPKAQAEAVQLITKPTEQPATLATVIIERIRSGTTLEETKEYYKFLREIQADEIREQAKREFIRARSLIEEELMPIAQDCANPQTKSRYASLAQVVTAIRPVYSKHGVSVSFDTADSPKGEMWIRILAGVAHTGGYSREYHIDMPADGKGAQGRDVMTRTHATGSAITYGRRYLLLMIFNLAVGGEDDDGNAAPNGIRDNPHTVKAQDITDVPESDDPDRVPLPDKLVQELPKMQQRPIAENLGKELASFANLENLERWKNLPETAHRLATIRFEWREIFQGRVKERLMELRGARKMQELGEPEADWLAELDKAYQACEDAAAFFEVDKKMFAPIIPTMPPEDRRKAQEIRQEHFARVSGEA